MKWSSAFLLLITGLLLGVAVDRALLMARTPDLTNSPVARLVPWRFPDLPATAQAYADAVPQPYRAQIITTTEQEPWPFPAVREEAWRNRDGPGRVLELWDHDRRVLRIPLHGGTPFVVLGKQMFMVDYNSISDGGQLLAINLIDGTLAWQRDLRGMGVNHSQFHNAIRLTVGSLRGGSFLILNGDTTAGRWVSCHDPHAGGDFSHWILEIRPGWQLRDEVIDER